MARTDNLDHFLTDIADSIRSKKGTEATIAANTFDTEINNFVLLNGETKTVTPSTSQQTITPTSPKNGITQVTVNAVDNTIDQNITSGNIKSGVSILGVSGSVVELQGETKTVKSTTISQTVLPSNGKNGITEITVSPIDLETKSVTPSTSAQTINPTSGKDGISQINVSAVTSSIDANITAGNIKKDVEILGVTGTYEGSGGGSQETELKDINFFDYDGTLLYSYDRFDFITGVVTELPPNPSHTGLVAQGWNWSFNDAKDFVMSGIQRLNIGQMYTTTDGSTKLYITLTKNRLSPYISPCVNGSVEVDWGDGSATQTITGTSTSSRVHTQHTYANEGDYVISIKPTTNSTFGFVGVDSTKGSAVLWCQNDNTEINAYHSCITKIEFGDGIVNLGDFAFCGLKQLKTITFSKTSNITINGSTMFKECVNLKAVVLPQSNTEYQNLQLTSSMFSSCYKLTVVSVPKYTENSTLGSSIFNNCYNLKTVTLPTTITALGTTEVFYNCYALSELIIPEPAVGETTMTIPQKAFGSCFNIDRLELQGFDVTIGNSVFYGCSNLKYIDIATVSAIGTSAFANCYSLIYCMIGNTEQIPTVSANSFGTISSLPNSFKIVVDDELYDDYLHDSVWSMFAGHIISMSDWMQIWNTI